MIITKVCNKCGVRKSITEFYKHLKAKDQLKGQCKSCSKISRKDWYTRNREMTCLRTNSNRWRKLGVLNSEGFAFTIEDYKRLLKQQNFSCEICGVIRDKTFSRLLHVDHDHKTNLARGLLCDGCNTKVGVVESPLCYSVLEYVKKYKGGSFI